MVTRQYFTVPSTESILISSRNIIIRSAKAVIQVVRIFPSHLSLQFCHTHTLIPVLPLHLFSMQFVLQWVLLNELILNYLST